MPVKGSNPEGQEFFANVAKLQDRLQDRASARLMARNGWKTEWPVCPLINHIVMPEMLARKRNSERECFKTNNFASQSYLSIGCL